MRSGGSGSQRLVATVVAREERKEDDGYDAVNTDGQGEGMDTGSVD